MAATRLRALYRPLTELLEAMAVVLVLGVGVWALAHNQITVGGPGGVRDLPHQALQPDQGGRSAVQHVYAASASAERIIDLLSQQPDVREPARHGAAAAAPGGGPEEVRRRAG